MRRKLIVIQLIIGLFVFGKREDTESVWNKIQNPSALLMLDVCVCARANKH